MESFIPLQELLNFHPFALLRDIHLSSADRTGELALMDTVSTRERSIFPSKRLYVMYVYTSGLADRFKPKKRRTKPGSVQRRVAQGVPEALTRARRVSTLSRGITTWQNPLHGHVVRTT